MNGSGVAGLLELLKEARTVTNRRFAVGLARCSTDMQDHSIADQESEIRAFAAASSVELLEVFGDEGISGSELNRPGLNALLAFIEDPARAHGGVVVVWKRNRLARPQDPRDGLLLERRIENAGWALHYLHGSKQTGDALMDTIMGVIEHHQSGEYLTTLSTDTWRGLIGRILDGDVPGGKIPYGFQKVLIEPDGSEQRVSRRQKHRKLKEQRTRLEPGDTGERDIVRDIFLRYASGTTSLASIAKDLNDRHIPSPSGGVWVGGTIRDILTNPVYVGDLVWNRETTSKLYRRAGGTTVKKEPAHKSIRPSKTRDTTHYAANKPEDWVRIPDHHQGIIDRDLFDQAQEVRKRRGIAQGGQRRVHNVYALTGILYCACCGKRMSGMSNSTLIKRKGGLRVRKHYKRYMCQSRGQNGGCEPYQVLAPALEGTILKKLRDTYVPALPEDKTRRRLTGILRRKLGSEVSGPSIDRLREQRTRLDGKIAKAIDNLGLVDGESAKQLAERIRKWRAELATLDQTLGGAKAQTMEESNLHEAVDEIMSMLSGLVEVGRDAAPENLKKLLQRTVVRVDLQFETLPPKPGRKLQRHRLTGGRIVANSLLGALAGAVHKSNDRPEPIVASGESSSGVIRTRDQVVNSHLLYR